jgi:antitoxin PrlF
MDVRATVSSKGQITIPKPVRDALGLDEGDHVVFRVLDGAAVLARTANLIELAGSVPVPAGAAGLGLDEVRRRAHTAQARRSA